MIKVARKRLDKLNLYIKEDQFLSCYRAIILNDFELKLNDAIKNLKEGSNGDNILEFETKLFLERYKMRLLSAKEQIDDIKNHIAKINSVGINKNSLPSRLIEIYIFTTDNKISSQKIFKMLLTKYNLIVDDMKRDLSEIFMHRSIPYTNDNKGINYQDSEIPPLIKEALKSVE